MSLAIPMGTKPSETNGLSKLTKITVYYESERLVMITKIPLETEMELILYNLLSMPIARMILRMITNT